MCTRTNGHVLVRNPGIAVPSPYAWWQPILLLGAVFGRLNENVPAKGWALRRRVPWVCLDRYQPPGERNWSASTVDGTGARASKVIVTLVAMRSRVTRSVAAWRVTRSIADVKAESTLLTQYLWTRRLASTESAGGGHDRHRQCPADSARTQPSGPDSSFLPLSVEKRFARWSSRHNRTTGRVCPARAPGRLPWIAAPASPDVPIAVPGDRALGPCALNTGASRLVPFPR